MNKPMVPPVLCLLFSWTLSIPAFAGEGRQAPNPIAEVNISPTRVDWVPAVDAERWVLTVLGPGDFFLRRQFEAGKTPFLSLLDTEGNRLPDGSYSWELRGIQERETEAPEPPSRHRETGKTFNAPQAPELELSSYLTIRDGSFVAVPSTVERPESPLQNVIAKDSLLTGRFSNDGNACIGDECNSLSDASFSALKLRSTLPHLYFDDVELPCEGCPTGNPHDWAVLINQSSTDQLAISEFVDDVLTSTPFTLRGGAPDNSLFIDATGKVGIGTSTPADRLDVKTNSSAAATGRVQNSSATGFSGFEYTNNSGTVISFLGVDNANATTRLNSNGSYPIALLTNSTERMRVTAAGNVGIGTASPASRLDVQCDAAGACVKIQNSNATGYSGFSLFEEGGTEVTFFGVDNANNNLRLNATNSFPIVIFTNSTERIRFPAPGGNFITAANGASLTAGGTWTNASSRTYKENIVDLDAAEALATIQGLDPVKFQYTSEPGEQYVGFIAEDVPELVAMNDHKSLSSMDIVAVLTKVVQEQQKTIDELSTRLAQLEKAKSHPASMP